MFCSVQRAAVIMIFGLCSWLLAGENTWTTNGPSGATVYTIEINPLNRDNIYIGTISNGIYKTMDGGEHWQHIDNNNTFICLRDIAINPCSPETIFAGTIRGPYMSADGGATWNFVWLPQNYFNEVDVIQYHPTQPGLIFAGTPVDAWRSADGGATWEAMDIPPLTGMVSMKIASGNPDLIYFLGTSMYTDRGVWKSEDRGLTWTNVHNNIELIGSGTDIDIDPVDNNIVYISVDNLLDPGEPCIYKTIDGGADWADISPAFLVDPYVLSIAISPANHQVIYAATGDNGVIKSEDAGNTWVEFNAGLHNRHMVAIKIDAANLNMYLGTIYDGIYKKHLNAGAWRRISSNINTAECYGIDICSSNPDKAYVVAANGLFYTENLGESWSYVDIGIPAGNIVWDAAFDRYLPNLLYASSGNDTFNRALLASNGFYKSQDNGNSWEFLNNGLPDSLSYSTIKISYLNDNSRRIFLGSDNGLYYSDNSGDSWEICERELPTDLSYGIVEVSPSNPNVVAAANFWHNRMFISHDRGNSWEEPGELPNTDNYGIEYLEFSPNDPDHIYVSIYDVGLFESFDGGINWHNITNDLPVDPNYPNITGIAVNPLNPSNIFVASVHFGIYQSHNGGENWESYNAGFDTTNAYGHMKFAPGDTTKLYFADGSHSVWSIHRTPTGIDDDDQALPTQFAVSAYPNPFNATANISFSLPEAGNVRLDIYDLLGRQTASLLDSFLPAGNHSLLWHPEDLAAGIYIYRLTTHTGLATDYYQISKKITLLK